MINTCSHLLVEVFKDSFNVLVLPDEFHSSLWTNASDGVAVVTSQQDAQVNELKTQIKLYWLTGYNDEAASSG